LAGVFAGTEYAEYPLVPKSVMAEFKRHQEREEEAEAALKEVIGRQRSELAEILAGRASQYGAAGLKVPRGPKLPVKRRDGKEELDQETLERWIAYLSKPQHDYPYLDGWNKLLARPASIDEARTVADEFQHTVLRTLAAKKEVDEDNHPALREAEAARNKRHK